MAITFLSFAAFAQQVQRADFDITDYKMDVQILPDDNKLNATVDVYFTPRRKPEHVTFELNGSIKIDSITRINGVSRGATASRRKRQNPPSGKNQFAGSNFRAGSGRRFGSWVRMSGLISAIWSAANAPVALRFKYSGILTSAQGGPLLTKRLAYVGSRDGYLMYAARWFPFHDYAADRATTDITISVPSGFQIVGYSDTPVTNSGRKISFCPY